MPKITFSRTTDGGVDLSDLGAVKAHFRDPDSAQLSVTREVRLAAEEQVVEAARQLQFLSGRPFFECAKEVTRRNPELFRLSRAPVDMDKFATITVRP